MTKRAVTYSRVSGDDTQKENLNIDGQIRDCREYAISKGYHVIEEIAEDPKTSTSGADSSLPGFQRVWQLAKTKSFDVLICRQMDRLSRDQMKYLTLKTHLKQHDITIEFLNISGSYEDNFSGKIIESVMALIAENERDEIRKRTMRGKRNKVKAGNVMLSNTRPFGYKLGKDSDGRTVLIIDDNESRIVRKIFEWYLTGDYSILAIARKLTGLSIATVYDTMPNRQSEKKRPFGTWGHSSVRKILGYETYATGVWFYGKQTKEKIPVNVPKIIPQETFDNAQKQLAINAKNSRRNKKYEYLMAGRAICGHCKGAMQGHSVIANKRTNPKTYLYYNDVAATKKNMVSYSCDNRANYPVNTIDTEVWAFIVSLFDNPGLLEQKLFEQLQLNESDLSPLREQLEITQSLIDKHTERLTDLIRSLNLFKGKKADRAKEAIAKDIEQAEMTIDKLEIEANKLKKQITSQAKLTEDGITDIVGLMAKFGDKLHRVRTFGDRREVIKMLDVRITLWSESNGKGKRPTKHCKATCLVGEGLLCIESTQPRLGNRNTQHIETIILTHTFSLNAPQYSIAA